MSKNRATISSAIDATNDSSPPLDFSFKYIAGFQGELILPSKWHVSAPSACMDVRFVTIPAFYELIYVLIIFPSDTLDEEPRQSLRKLEVRDLLGSGQNHCKNLWLLFRIHIKNMRNVYIFQKSPETGKYRTSSLRLNNNAITDFDTFTSTLDDLIEDPKELAWLDLSFNDLSTINTVRFDLCML